MGGPVKQGRLDPGSLPVADAARALSRAGGVPVSEADIRADIAAGAPTNPDGTVNIVHYAAWLARTVASGEIGAD